MTEEEAIDKIDLLDGGDPECAHSMADEILEQLVSPGVRDAIQRLRDRCAWRATA